jgi:hypothetical protein
VHPLCRLPRGNTGLDPGHNLGLYPRRRARADFDGAGESGVAVDTGATFTRDAFYLGYFQQAVLLCCGLVCDVSVPFRLLVDSWQVSRI